MLRLNGAVAVAVFVVLTAVVALQVLNRFVLHLPLIWSEEVARFLFFWVVLLGAAIGVRRRRHFVIDVAPGRRPAGGWPGLVRDAVPDVSILAFSVFLLIQGLAYVQVGVYRTSTNAEVNMGLVYAAIPAFAALSIAYAGSNLIADYRAFRRGGRAAAPPSPAE
jgi:TRAP-type C4-dicarboxylate transport system permease small subunit